LTVSIYLFINSCAAVSLMKCKVESIRQITGARFTVFYNI